VRASPLAAWDGLGASRLGIGPLGCLRGNVAETSASSHRPSAADSPRGEGRSIPGERSEPAIPGAKRRGFGYSSRRLKVPDWVQPLVDRSSGHLLLLEASIAGATSLAAQHLSQAVADAYRSLGHQLARERRYPVRIWNFVPDIQAPMGDGDRYMAFNAGRYAAYSEWFGSADRLSASVPTASAVGVSGDTLSIHVLAADAPGVPVENPRQIPAYRYSERYGVRPPCFARATKLNGTLLIGGTASIVGEDSFHPNDIQTQTRETFHNLEALITSAHERARGRALSSIIDLRVHVIDRRYQPAVAAILGELVAGRCEVEFVEAELCRRELLVEIEGRAACR
jgi:chorismate lyase/3-hydroxybenzoate synthase